jgi:hypothetical protein
MCKTCNTLKINADIDGIIALMDSMDDMRPLTREDDRCYRGMDTYLGSIEVDEDEARSTLAVELGDWATVSKLQDKHTPISGVDQEDIEHRAELVNELQARMDKGMSMIEECNERLAYFKAGNYVPKPVFMAWVERRSRLWTHWFKLKDEKMALANHKAVWAKAYKLEEGDTGKYDPISHKRSAPDLDERMLTSDEAYFQADMEEQQELFAYVG